MDQRKSHIVAVSLTQMDPFIESIEPAKGVSSVYMTCVTVPSALIPISSLNPLHKAQYVIQKFSVLGEGGSCSSQVIPQWGSFLVIFNGRAIYPFSGNKGIFSCHKLDASATDIY